VTPARDLPGLQGWDRKNFHYQIKTKGLIGKPAYFHMDWLFVMFEDVISHSM